MSVFVGFLIGIVIFIFDFIGDYYVCVKMCNFFFLLVYSVNWGIVIEGFCSLIVGFFGCGYVMIMYGGNIGVIGVIKVKI